MSENKKGKLEVFRGEVRWATIPPRDPRGPSKDYVTDANRDDLTYSIEVECSEERFKQLKKAGIPRLTDLKEDENTGKTFIRLKAPKHKTNPAQPGNPYVYGNLQTFNSDGTPLTESVGNGSTAIVTAYLRDNPRGGKTLRLHAVKILNLIPWEGGGMSLEERKALGLPDNQPTIVDSLGSSDETLNAEDIF